MEFYIRDIGDPHYDSTEIQTSSEISMLLTQLETLLFTRRGDVMGDPEFGANLDDYVYALRYNETMLKGVIEKQIAYYIPLAAKYNTQVEVTFTDQDTRHLLFVDIIIDSKYQLALFI